MNLPTKDRDKTRDEVEARVEALLASKDDECLVVEKKLVIGL